MYVWCVWCVCVRACVRVLLTLPRVWSGRVDLFILIKKMYDNSIVFVNDILDEYGSFIDI